MKRSAAAIFMTSATVIALELSLIRHLSFSGYHHFSYLVISIALTGFGAGGVFLFFLREAVQRDIRLFTLAGSFVFAAAVPLCFSAAVLLKIDIHYTLFSFGRIALLFLYILLIFVPFFAAAVLSGGLIFYHSSRVSVLYGISLAAGGLGAAAAVLLMFFVPPHRLAGVVSLLPLANFILQSAGSGSPGAARRHNVRRYLPGAVLLAFNILGWAVQSDPRVDPYKDYSFFERLRGQGQAQKVSTAYGPAGRIDVFDSPYFHHTLFAGPSAPSVPPPQLALLVDGTLAGSIVKDGAAAGTDILDHTPQSLVYRLTDSPRVLLLGDAGTANSRLAGRNGAASVTLVQSDANILRVMAPALPSGVKTVRDDPRHYLKRPGNSYDIIQIAAAEGSPSGSGGLLSLREDYLLTVEAVREALGKLSDSGYIAVTRGVQSPPRDNIRIFALFAEALKEAGIRDPGAHLLQARNYLAVTTLVSRAEIGADTIEAFRGACAGLFMDAEYYPGIESGSVGQVNLAPGPPGKNYSYYHHAAGEILGGRAEALYKSYLYHLRPPTDSRPYFHDFFRWKSLGELIAAYGPVWFQRLELGYFILIVTAGMAAAAGGVLILVPVLLLKRSGDGGTGFTVAYFAAIGFAFMFLEIVFIQKFTLLLGNPVYSVAVCLAGILVFSGLGSYAQGRLGTREGTRAGIAFAAIAGTAALYLIFSDTVLGLFWGAPVAVRLLVTLSGLSVPAFFMGWFFPVGISLIRGREGLVPLAWAANGFASVCAAPAAVITAMSAGFTAVAAAALVLYAFCACIAAGFEA